METWCYRGEVQGFLRCAQESVGSARIEGSVETKKAPLSNLVLCVKLLRCRIAGSPKCCFCSMQGFQKSDSRPGSKFLVPAWKPPGVEGSRVRAQSAVCCPAAEEAPTGYHLTARFSGASSGGLHGLQRASRIFPGFCRASINVSIVPLAACSLVCTNRPARMSR